MLNSLSARIIQVIVIMVLMTAFLVLLAAWDNTSRAVHRNIYGALKSVSTSVETELSEFSEEKSKQVSLYFNDTSQQIALLSQSDEKVHAQLTELSLNVPTDLFIWNNSIFTVKNTNTEFVLTPSLVDNIIARAEQADYFIVINNHNAYMFMKHLITNADDAKINQRYLYSAYLMNTSWLSELASEAGLHISLVIDGSARQVPTSLTKFDVSLGDLLSGEVSDSYFSLLSPAVFVGSQKLFTMPVVLNNVLDGNATLYLSISAERVSDNFVELQLTIAAVAAISVLIAASFGAFLARKIAKPLKIAARHSRNIADGIYQSEPPSKGHFTEVNELLYCLEKMKTDISEREKAIVFQAQHDSVTKLFNRKFVKQAIDEKFEQGIDFQAVVINLSDFRHINDVFGYQLGDRCLITIAQRLSELDGIIARLTGGKFVWLPEKKTSSTELLGVSKLLRMPVEDAEISIPIKVSIGCLRCPEEADNAEVFFRRLAIVVESSKSDINRISTFSLAIEDDYLRRIRIIASLRQALKVNHQELELVYQPKLSLNNTKKVQLEALLRWTNPELGNVGPAEFIRIAEDAGFINHLTYWVVERALQDAVYFQSQGVDVEIAINVSIDDIMHPLFIENLIEKIEEYKLNSSYIAIELTESVMAQDQNHVIDILSKLKNLGFSVAIDDFGTGYSSLAYLAVFPATTIKLDRSFVMTLSASSANQKMCQHIINLAKDFDLQVVAEGIEDQVALDYLRQYGCDWGQGYYICKPTSREAVLEWIKQG